ncbi:MAG: hypothetical protein AB2L09_10115 [Coriobacteriia bacterium]
MRILGKNGAEIATVALQAKKGEPLVARTRVPAAKLAVDAKIALEKVGDDLIAHITMGGWAFDAVVTLDDIAGAKAAMNGDVFRFALKAMMK